MKDNHLKIELSSDVRNRDRTIKKDSYGRDLISKIDAGSKFSLTKPIYPQLHPLSALLSLPSWVQVGLTWLSRVIHLWHSASRLGPGLILHLLPILSDSIFSLCSCLILTYLTSPILWSLFPFP